MKVKINYGDSPIELEIPDKNFAGKIIPKALKIKENTLQVLQDAMNNSEINLFEITKGKSVCVMIEDHTRSEPHKELIETLSANLKNADFIQFVIATGTHEVEHPENIEILNMINQSAKKYNLNYDAYIHDGLNGDFEEVGTTSFGTKVLVDKKCIGHDVYVVAADMKAHYFAGYSAPVKDFLPGICAFETIEHNHSFAIHDNATFGRHPMHSDIHRRSNPVAEDMVEAMNLIINQSPVFVLGVITSNKKIIWAKAGDINQVSTEAFDVLDEIASFTVEPVDRIIVSPGGYPFDLSIYASQRALELTKNAIKENGEILFLAECRDGIAPNQEAKELFYDKLTQPIPKVIEDISQKYKLYTHKAYKFARLIQKVNKIWMYTTLSKEDVERIHLYKAEDPQDVIDKWIKENPDVKILVFDKASKLTIYAK